MKFIFLTTILSTLISLIFTQAGQSFNTDISANMAKRLGQDSLNYQWINGGLNIQDDSNTFLFYSLITNQGVQNYEQVPADVPVIFWYNGGPGCSSQFGLWLEIGPVACDGELKVSERQLSWNKNAVLIFIDQPINAGLSYSDDPNVKVHSTKEAGPMVMTFLQNFYGIYSNLTKNPTYFFGESYAGHYIPYYATLINNGGLGDIKLNFQGIGIGDGWTDPLYQLGSMDNFFYQTATASQGQKVKIFETQTQAQAAIVDGEYAEATHLFDAITDDTAQYGEIDQYNLFHYNVNGQEDPNTIQYFQDLFNQEDFKSDYAIPSYEPNFSNCNDTIYDDFNNDFTVSYKTYVNSLIESGYKVMLFNGQLDIIVNAAGAQDWINTLEWGKLRNWQYAKKKLMMASETAVYGNYQHYDNFVYVNVYLAGHMVPSDQPEASNEMLRRFLSWDW